MKNFRLFLARTALLGALALCAQSNVQASVAIEHWQQPSGAQVYLVPSPALPMLDVEIDFDAGSRREPVDQAGLAVVTAALATQGVLADGAAQQPALDENAIGEAWADLGASFVAHAGNERTSFHLRTLTYPELLPAAVALAARQLAQPSFPAEVWQRERESLMAALKEADTRPGTWAERAFRQAVYGNHPYAHEMTEATLSRIEVADMAAWYRRLILPCRAKVTLVGAIDRAQADALVHRLLDRIPAPAACPALPPVPEVQPLRKPVEQHMPFDSAQAHVLIGQPGFRRDDPDYFALTVGNHILGGGGFASRLTEEVREKRGLSYSVYSYFSPGLHAGAFTVGLQTRPDQVGQAVDVVRSVVRRFVTEGPTAQELAAAKANLIGGFALRLDSNRKLLGNVANIAWYGLPLDYLDTWTQQVDQLDVADVKAAFARTLDPDRMVTIVVGARSAPGDTAHLKGDTPANIPAHDPTNPPLR